MSGINLENLSLDQLELLRHEVFLRTEELQSDIHKAYIIRTVRKNGYIVSHKDETTLPSLIMQIKLKYYENKTNEWATVLEYVPDVSSKDEGKDEYTPLFLYYTSYNTKIPSSDFVAINDLGNVMRFKYDHANDSHTCNGEEFTKEALEELIEGEPGYHTEYMNYGFYKIFIIQK
jgi:hypothetical protein